MRGCMVLFTDLYGISTTPSCYLEDSSPPLLALLGIGITSERETRTRIFPSLVLIHSSSVPLENTGGD
jgi:hypothetical protein